MAQDYKTRLTADTSQHDNALKRSAQQVYQYKKGVDNAKVTLGNLAKKFSPLAMQIGLAGGALATFTKAIRSTEQGADAMDRTIHTAKSSVNKFFQSLTSGNFDSFIGGLSDIVSTAKDAYNALDDLGTLKMWSNAKIEQLKAEIAMDRVVVNNANTSSGDRTAAQKRIELNMQKIQALTGDIVEGTLDAATKKLREIAGTGKVSDAQLKKYLEMWEQGTLSQHYSQFIQSHSHEETVQSSGRGGGMNGGFIYTTTQTKWDDENNRILAAAMASILHTNEEELQQYYNLLTEAAQLQQTTAAQQNKANTLTNKGNGSGSGKTPKVTIQTEVEPLPEGSIAELESQLAELRKSYSLAPTDEERNNLRQQIATMQTELDRMNGKNEVEIAPVIPEGSIAYLQQKIRELTEQMENTPDAELRIKLIADISDVQNQLKEMQTTDAERAAEALRKKYEEVQKQTEATASAFNQIGSVFSSLGDCMDDEGKRFMQVVGTIFSGISTLIPQIAALTATEEAEAMAAGTASAAKLPFPYNLASIASVVATLVGVFASISSIAHSGYADGGIIQGKTTVGDWNLARVNGGEMILNSTQQSRLFKMLNNPIVSTQSTDGGNVTFTIHGSDLMGTLNNYNKKRNRVI